MAEVAVRVDPPSAASIIPLAPLQGADMQRRRRMVGNVAAAVALFACSRGAMAATLIGVAGRRTGSWRSKKGSLATGRTAGSSKGNGAARLAASKTPESGKSVVRASGRNYPSDFRSRGDGSAVRAMALRLCESGLGPDKGARVFSCALVTASNHGLEVG